MAFLEWESDLDTGIEVIDGQHRRIVEMINGLHVAQEQGDTGAVARVIEEVVDYTVSHFAFEETLLEDAGYLFSRAHKKVHELFIRRVDLLRRRHQAGDDVADELKDLLGRWLFNHIRNDDAAYVGAVKANMQRLTRDESGDGWLSRSMRRFFG
ncbi:bacteriohemerythrin [Metapseudomonas furukawaii]|uniref:Hemerythrin-like protein PA1673 n=1 Tax=Metapseudomonas furukawaii TaxID=1149133 RepID=A0AAD1BYP3_METFU|nr:bacteriohemerythrin [Pseudomonas furukawaii]ELS28861.1 Hemerythrin-like protein [Pseudomonas furukawaii]BAU73637.1 hemerythrin-like protein PA1673 [Pseudomonas furukawaii]